LVFAQIPDLNGWSLDEMIFLYGYFQLPRGLDHLLTDNIWLIPSRVRRGDIDRYLLRPINPLFQVIVERFQIEAFGELAIGILLVAYAIPRLSIVWTPLTVLLGAGVYSVGFTHLHLDQTDHGLDRFLGHQFDADHDDGLQHR
jgi:ABC-2 type transport system permease protein